LRSRSISVDVLLPELAPLLEGCSRADIVGICRKARAMPFIEAAKMGQERDVEMRNFLAVMQDARPSVDKQDLARFGQYSRDE
jgi:SpoVK/Ycf46/Vps4 family AAA+-type ATPase